MNNTSLDTPLPLTVSEARGIKPANIVRAVTRMAVERLVDGQREFLFVKHPVKGWELPGGAVDPSETGYEAALREFCEETGLAIDPQFEVKLVETIAVDAGPAGFWLDLVYHAEIGNATLQSIGEPEFDMQWMRVKQLREATSDKYVRLFGSLMALDDD